ncbi:MAG: type IV pilus modification protein PilV [Ideonella sp.]|nr:type IV pilus modification protein PilV [Ideonella sp.]MCC7457799.1 type IV pilus modification protein PilV [Nitrospira sp.]
MRGKHNPTRRNRRQDGFSLIEALVAIFIFSIGILALIALQVTSVRQSTNAKYRSEAALLANRLLGEMWVSDRVAANLQTNFGTGGTVYNTWNTAVQATLPASGASAPQVSVSASGIVQVDIFWKAPNEGASAPAHRYTTMAQIH